MNKKCLFSMLLVGFILRADHIVYVSTEEIMRTSLPAQQASKELEAKREKMMKQYDQMVQKIRTKEEDLQKKRSTMSTEAVNKEIVAINSLKQDLEGGQKKWTQELQLDMQTETQKLAKIFEDVVKEFAEKNPYDMILEKETGRVLWAKPNHDVTGSIRLAMDTKHSKATTTASAAKPVAKVS